MQALEKGNIIRVNAPDGERFGIVVDFADAYGATDILYINVAGRTFLDSAIIEDHEAINVVGHIDGAVIRRTVLCNNPQSIN